MSSYVHEDLAHFFLDLGEFLIGDLDIIKISIILVDLTAEDSSSELNLKVITELFEGLGFSRVILLMLLAAWGIALDGVHPDVGRSSIENHVKGVV